MHVKIPSLRLQTALILFTFSFFAMAQTEERVLEVDVPSKGAEARQEAFSKAVQAVSRELAERRLGAQFVSENPKRFEADVLAKSDKYVLSIKGTGTKATEEGTRFTVALTLSHDGFESVLRQSGLLQLSRSALTAVVLLDEQDKALKEGPWWAQAQLAPLEKNVQTLRAKMVQSLKRRGVEVLDQKKLYQEMPPELKKANLSREELVHIGKKTRATVVLYGLIQPKAGGNFVYHAQWIQIPAERVLSELQGEAKESDLSVRLLEPVEQAQARGTLNARPLVLRIRGDLNPQDLKAFKDELLLKARDLRSLRERVLGRGDFSFEAESPLPPNGLVTSIQALSFKDFQLKASLEGEDQILLSVKKR